MKHFEDFWESTKAAVEHTLQAALTLPDHELTQAMRYCALGGGKRLRALLIYATADAVADSQNAHVAASAAAVELIHAYSLVHDDLPAMDDDALRRGKPTCHIAFGEAMAILTGDALQTLAFQLLAETPEPERAIAAVGVLARRSGAAGMVLGQACDINAEGQALSLQALQNIHRHKTGDLILASVELGLIAGNPTLEQKQALLQYGENVGLLFQIQDDILDVESDAATLGKATQKDATLEKATYPALMGLSEAKKKRDALLEDSLNLLASVQLQSGYLADIARMAANRKH